MRKPSKEMKLEERIECVLCAQELELDGNAYLGKYELNDIKSIREFIKGKFKNTYENQDTGAKIVVSKTSAKKLAGRAIPDGECLQRTLVHIPRIIEQMQFLEKLPPDKADPNFSEYSYYIVKANIDGESHTILSVVGYKGNEIYYDQNMFKGTAQEVFEKAINTTDDPKYSRLNEILRKTKKGG
jgi:hypothetical protein